MQYNKLFGLSDVWKMLEHGVKNNTIVLDGDAKPGEITLKLLWNIRESAGVQKFLLHTLIIPVWETKKEWDKIVPGTLTQGFFISPNEILDSQHVIDYYKEHLKATMPYGKEFLVIAHGNNDVLLGAF